jgi:hypothetical protein
MPETVYWRNGQTRSPNGGGVRRPWIHPDDRAEIAATLRDDETPETETEETRMRRDDERTPPPRTRFTGGRTGHDRERGIYRKYDVQRVDGRADKHSGCEYFVLDLTHDKFAPAALAAYAAACAEEFPALSADLRQIVGRSDHG